jgi:hypothetical protein
MAGPDAGRRGVLRALRLAAAVLAVAIGGAGNVLRTACWTQSDGFVCGPFASGSAIPAATTVTGLTRIAVPAPAWRPLRVTLRAGPAPGIAAAPLRLAANASLAGATSLAPDGPPVTIETTGGHDVERITLWAEGAPPGGGAIAIDAVSPARAAWPGIRAFTIGALAVATVLWAIGGPRPARAPDVAGADGGSARAPRSAIAMAALTGLLAVYVAWAFLKPPMQSPDEPQHQARATSIPSAPWVGGRLEVTVVPAHRNPLTWTPNPLHAIVLRPDVRLRADEVAALRATPWQPVSAYPPAERFTSPVASYPPLYYWLVFAGGETLTRVFHLTPWNSFLAYRVVSLAAAWLLWVAVHRVLAAAPATRAHAVAIVLLAAGTPTVATLASSVNPDAIAIPAVVLLAAASWRVLAAGDRHGTALAAAALALAVKPIGVFAVAAAVASAAAWGWRSPGARPRAARLIRDLLAAGLLSWIAFYAWSPPAVLPAPAAIGWPAYAASLVTRAPALWIEFWGRLGWSEFSAPPAWYAAIAVVCAAGAVLVRLRPADDDGFGRHALVTSAVFAACVVAGELVNRAQAGLFLQGRYFAPAGLVLGPLVARRDAIRWLLPGLVAALHVALAFAAVDRYFAGDWSLWWRSVTGGS